MNIEQRQQIERQIVHQIVTDAITHGYFVSVHNGEEITVTRSNSVKVVMAETMSVDEEHLFFTSASGAEVGWVFLVYGNGGYDVICDYTTNLEELMKGAETLADELEERHG
jgi:hypothetical protein